jgi:hypothetical protein
VIDLMRLTVRKITQHAQLVNSNVIMGNVLNTLSFAIKYQIVPTSLMSPHIAMLTSVLKLKSINAVINALTLSPATIAIVIKDTNC